MILAISKAHAYQLADDQKIVVKTSLYEAEINTVGGDIRKLKLVNFQNDSKDGLYEILNDEMNPLLYIAQSGLIGKNLPTHKDLFKSEQLQYESKDIDVSVPIFFENEDVKVVKTYIFSNDNYQIKLVTSITNKSDSDLTASNLLSVVTRSSIRREIRHDANLYRRILFYRGE